MQYFKSISGSLASRFQITWLLTIVAFIGSLLALTLYAVTPIKAASTEENWVIDTSSDRYIRMVVNGNVT